MLLDIYAIHPNKHISVKVGGINRISDMGNWLKKHGEIEKIYELHKGMNSTSRWIWREKVKRWGKAPTQPSK